MHAILIFCSLFAEWRQTLTSDCVFNLISGFLSANQARVKIGYYDGVFFHKRRLIVLRSKHHYLCVWLHKMDIVKVFLNSHEFDGINSLISVW